MATCFEENLYVWYPDLYAKTYFQPPLYFNRVPYKETEEMIAGEKVAVAQPESNSSEKCKEKVCESDVRDDRAKELVYNALRALLEKEEGVMVIFHLEFRSLQSFISGSSLKQEKRRGVCDILIIHSLYGLIIGSVKSVGCNFKKLDSGQATEDIQTKDIQTKVKLATSRLNKSEVFLKCVLSDMIWMKEINIIKTIMLPFLSHKELEQATGSGFQTPPEKNDLQKCLGENAVKKCLCLDAKETEALQVDLTALSSWWYSLVKTDTALTKSTRMPEDLYKLLVARFCGSAASVDVHSQQAPRLELRTLADAVYETGERIARFVLLQEQMDVINNPPKHLFLSGPPGTGKTLVLILLGLKCLRKRQTVHVVSAWEESRAVSFLIEHQIYETVRSPDFCKQYQCEYLKGKLEDKIVNRYQYDFLKDGDVVEAIKDVERNPQSRQLCVIVDEAIDSRNNEEFRKKYEAFCKFAKGVIPKTESLWAADMRSPKALKLSLSLEERNFTIPLRCPPVVVQEVRRAVENEKDSIDKYTRTEVPVPTQGPAIMQISHSVQEQGHGMLWPRSCEECGRLLAGKLKELTNNCGFSMQGGSTSPSITYDDVFVLFSAKTRLEKDSTCSGLDNGFIAGLRQCGIPVQVVESVNEEDVKSLALAQTGKVTVTLWKYVRGLERKIIVVAGYWPPRKLEVPESGMQDRLFGVSRCSSQLIFIKIDEESDSQ